MSTDWRSFVQINDSENSILLLMMMMMTTTTTTTTMDVTGNIWVTLFPSSSSSFIYLFLCIYL